MCDGILLVDKPVGFSSFQVVRVLKHFYKKVGHAGTLDPFASGLLIVLIGKTTKKFSEIQTYEKEYCGEIMLGLVTDTFDISGPVVNIVYNGQHISISNLNIVTDEFVGEIEQVPPRFSAIKQNGKRLYHLSRQGKYVIPKCRKVFVKSFFITGVNWPLLTFNVVVHKGVYIRSLIHDYGKRLGCGATLISLRRIKIGKHHVSEAQKLGSLLNTLSP